MVAAPSLAEATRRDIWAQAGALLLLSAAAAGPSKAAELDGELLACIAEADALEVRADALARGNPLVLGPPKLVEADELWDEAYTLRSRANALPARTPEGMQAKARSILRTLEVDSLASEMAMSLARDVLGRAGA